jgi:hypothetical protein
MFNTLTPLHALVLLFGTVSITRLAVSDTFPPILAVRNWVLQRFPFVGHVSERPFEGRKSVQSGSLYVSTETTWIGSLLHCPYCIGFWVSAAVTVAWWLFPVITLWVCLVMAFRWLTGACLSRFD